MFSNVYAGRRVLVTGHTGFKGSWLSTWLLKLGADVAGYSLNVPSTPANFEILALKNRMRHVSGDVRDRQRLRELFDEFRPEMVFHLAAQALVRRSYLDPVTTFEVNAMGTMNVLECIRQSPTVRAGVIITSDKCYRNAEWTWGYRENDRLGGEDPYSGSKGCAELIFHSYFHSFFKKDGTAAIATSRAGNVIGGGDWAQDRIVPDCIRSWSRGETVTLRNPRATRPWQHVLEPLGGYLWLGAHLWRREAKVMGNSYNFGPDACVNQSVEELIERMARYWPGARWAVDGGGSAENAEAALLKLNCDKALADLGWQATLSLDETTRFTSQWYQHYYSPAATDLYDFTARQIDEYCAKAAGKGLGWSKT